VDKRVEAVLEMIRLTRVNKGISIIELANMAEISHSYLFYIEAKRKIPTLTTLFKIADALQIDIKDLFK
jgi:transcriptional regulator with XRE-family HTH domain